VSEYYQSTPLNWENYERLLPARELARRAGINVNGQFIQDSRGKRYPPVSGIARRLLGRGKRLLLVKRSFSSYRVADNLNVCATEPSLGIENELAVEHALTATGERDREPFPSILTANNHSSESNKEPILPLAENTHADLVHKRAEPSSQAAEFNREPTPIPKRHAYYPSPLPNESDESTALHVYQTIEACTGTKTFSLSNARCLVDLYGADNVNAALAHLMVMHRKSKITSAAGFIVVAARLQWRVKHDNPLSPAPQFRGEKRGNR
jgi:hypothetical protein